MIICNFNFKIFLILPMTHNKRQSHSSMISALRTSLCNQTGALWTARENVTDISSDIYRADYVKLWTDQLYFKVSVVGGNQTLNT